MQTAASAGRVVWHDRAPPAAHGSAIAVERGNIDMIKTNGSVGTAPSFVITGVRLYWNDGSPAYIRQSAFSWINGAWEASLQISRSPSEVATAPAAAVLRLSVEVFGEWRERSREPVFETCRQVQDALRAHGDQLPLGIVELTDDHDWIAEDWFRDAIASRHPSD